MVHAVFFRLQILFVELTRLHDERLAPRDAQSMAFQTDQLLRIVRQNPYALHPQILQYLGTDAVFTQIRRETKTQIRIDRIQSALLQMVRMQLVSQTDAATFLPHVNDHAAAIRDDPLHRRVQLLAAVATQ